MFANLTEETCTGTGNTLALAGATLDSIPFSASFADGDLVAYVLRDSGGAIKVSGIGTYVAATDDITRNDNWNYNGTVVDKNPATNITLSAGTHTISCDLSESSFLSRVSSAMPAGRYLIPGGLEYSNNGKGGGEFTASIGKVTFTPITLVTHIKISEVYAAIGTVFAGGLFRLGLYGVDTGTGLPDQLLFDSGDIGTDTAGITGVSITPVIIPPGVYYMADAVNNTTATARGARFSIPVNGGFAGVATDRKGKKLQIAQTYGAFPGNGSTAIFGAEWASFGSFWR